MPHRERFWRRKQLFVRYFFRYKSADVEGDGKLSSRKKRQQYCALITVIGYVSNINLIVSLSLSALPWKIGRKKSFQRLINESSEKAINVTHVNW